jgi:hypothetical protein
MVCGGVAALSALPSFAKSCVGALPPTPYTGEGTRQGTVAQRVGTGLSWGHQ